MSSIFSRTVELQHRAWSVALRSALLPLGSLIRRSDRHLTWKLWEVVSGAERLGVYPEVGLGSILNPSVAVTLQSLPNQTYNVTELELLAVSALASQMQARTAFEIGTADGRTTLNMANNAAPGGTVFTLNLPLVNDAGHSQGVPVGFHFLDKTTAASIVQLWGNSQTFDYSEYVGRCQLVFVDADHFEPGVTTDSRTALRLVDSQNGVVVWHDALRFDVQSAVPRLARSEELPVHLITGTNLAVLFFMGGRAVHPAEWKQGQVS